MPRPPIQHHKLIISFDRDAKEVIEDVLDRATQLVGIRAAGEAAEGLLSNPSLSFLVTGGVLAGVAAISGQDLADKVISYFSALSAILAADNTADKSVAANQAANALKEILRLSPLGRGLIPP